MWASRRHPARSRGIALVMVLWVVILMGLMAAAFLRETRVGTGIARNLSENAKAEALADAGVRRAVMGLLDPEPSTGWVADGRPYQLTLGEGEIRIAMRDEAGKVDLNRAPAQMITGLLVATGVEPALAQSLTASVIDFRDPDHDVLSGGAEDAEYEAAGREFGAKDAPFDRTEELEQVLGFSNDLFERIAPYVTVHSGRPRIDITVAPEMVLRALPNMTPERIAQAMSLRATGQAVRRRSGIVSIEAAARTRGGGAFTREAIVRLTDRSDQPFVILQWGQSWPSEPDTSTQ